MQTPRVSGQLRVATGLNVLAGLWEIAAPFIWGYSAVTSALWNDIIVGVIVAVLAAFRFFGAGPIWLSWINAVLGVWLIISPFIFGYSNIGPALTNDIILGVIILVLGVWSALASRTGANM